MYRYQRPSVCTVKPGSSLPEPQGSVHQLHLRGRQPRTDVVARRTLGPEFFATHTGSDRLCFDHSRGRQQNRVTEVANHPRPNPVQISCQGRRVFVIGHVVENEQSRIAGTQRYAFCLFSQMCRFLRFFFYTYRRHLGRQRGYDR